MAGLPQQEIDAAIAAYLLEHPPASGGKVYSVQLTAGVLVTPVVITNTTGATCTITSPASGTIRFTFSSAVLTSGKVSVSYTPIGYSTPSGAGVTMLKYGYVSTTACDFYCSILDGSSFTATDYPEVIITITINS